MRLNCATKHLCGMRPIVMTNPQHYYCVNCSDPLHGALCGFLITELPPSANIDVRCMTDSGRSKFEERNMDASALICKYFLETLQDAHLKEPATSTTDSAASSNTETPAASTAASTNTKSAASTNTGSVVPEAASTPVIVDLSSTDDDVQPSQQWMPQARKNLPPKKARDKSLYRHFHIFVLPDGFVSIVCIHCDKYNKKHVQRFNFNASQARTHLITVCPGVTAELRYELSQGDQLGKRKAREFALASANLTVEYMRASAFNDTTPIVPKAIDLTSPPSHDTSQLTTLLGTDSSKRQFKTPTQDSGISDQQGYVWPDHVRSSYRLNHPRLGLSLHILYTISVGSFSCALKFTDLGSHKHVTGAEVKDDVKVCDEVKLETRRYMSSLAVDNSASGVAKKISQHFKDKDNKHVVVSRDPAHGCDLLSKNCAMLNSVKKVVSEAKETHTFVKNDRIDSMRLESVESGDLPESFAFAAQTLCETRSLSASAAG
eukprot:scaffold4251_cov37-Cyclotella_meneghiniana.AAC.3